MRPTFVVLPLAAVALVALPATASAAEVDLVAPLTAKAESPPGPSGGAGKAAVTVNTKTRQVCWTFTKLKNIDTPVAAHIHKGKKGVNGLIVVDFATPKYKSKGCVTAASKALAKDIATNPKNYYVNIHTKKFPGGAIRGQLAVAP
jgi:hypothetical protein